MANRYPLPDRPPNHAIVVADGAGVRASRPSR
jgi:hypothetical protein